MALKATIYKAELNIADMDRHYYQCHNLTIAQHPSETEERMMVRILAFALNAQEELSFTKGISTDNEPDIWKKSQTDSIDLWIDLGMPDEKRIRKACNRSEQVIIYTYGGHASEIWWHQVRQNLTRFKNLNVIDLPKETTQTLSVLVNRHMNLHCSIQDSDVTINDAEISIQLEPIVLMENGKILTQSAQN